MTDTFNDECQNCQITIARIEKWLDHINCSPKKYQRYDKLLHFVKMLSRENEEEKLNQDREWIIITAKNLIKEIGENND